MVVSAVMFFCGAMGIVDQHLWADDSSAQPGYRGPVDLLLMQNDTLALTANELSSSVSLVSLRDGRVLYELPVGEKPQSLAKLNAKAMLVTCQNSGTLELLEIVDQKLQRTSSITIGYHPKGLAVDAVRMRAFVSLMATGEVAEVDLVERQVIARHAVGRWPRYLALSPDGKRLAVGLSGDSAIAVLDAHHGEVLYEEPLSGGINLGHMEISSDGQQVYVPWMVYRSNPITVRNIRLGWVLASRVARVRLDGPAYREAISLDVPRQAMSDPFGIAITPNEKRLVVTSSGTHELLVYRLPDLPFVGAGGPGDLIDSRLLGDRDRFHRIELGGRPLAVRAMANDRQVATVNFTRDSIQIVDLEESQVQRSIALGTPPADSNQQLVHRGMEIFHDAGRSLDQWYSCQSCHLDGGSNAKAMDTWNDGSELTSKTVLPLVGVDETGPWTWHGWQQDLDDSLQNSFVSTMQGTEATQEDLAALKAYLSSCRSAPNPFIADGLSQAAARGRLLFHRSDVGCSECHSGTRFTDGEVHDVGLNSSADKYQGYNTPSLIDAYRKVRYLHDGRAKSLEAVLTEWHRPEDIGGGAELSEGEIADLVEYIKTL
ncbi:MAG: hypothetical protein KDB22_29785 [Planctomycetales bacterium]|nr:hypothetical protein [Planctomycetales bacterium]